MLRLTARVLAQGETGIAKDSELNNMFIPPLPAALTPTLSRGERALDLVPFSRGKTHYATKVSLKCVFKGLGMKAFDKLNDDSYLIRIPKELSFIGKLTHIA